MLITQTVIEQINLHHSNAMKQALEAVESAKTAGKLLLEVKATLPHGTWTEWLKKHVIVSDRQAQRYMSVALGKSVPIRKLAGKTDTVSVLPSQKSFGIWKDSKWEPEAGCLYLFNEDDAIYWVHPSTKGGKWFHVCKHYNGSRISTDGFFLRYTVFSTIDDPDLTCTNYVGTFTPLGWIGVEKVLKSYGLKDIQKSMIFGKKVDQGFDRPFGEPAIENWYWEQDGQMVTREAYFDALQRDLT